jgi:hypothetical protein
MGHIAVGTQQQQVRVRAIAVEALEAIAQDRELLQRSADLALQTTQGNLTPEEAARQISEDNPKVASLLDRAPEATRKILIWVLLTAITILAEHVVGKTWDPSATPADVERIVKQHDADVERIVRQHDRARDRDMQREIRDAVGRALQDYERQHPPAADRP